MSERNNKVAVLSVLTVKATVKTYKIEKYLAEDRSILISNINMLYYSLNSSIYT